MSSSSNGMKEEMSIGIHSMVCEYQFNSTDEDSYQSISSHDASDYNRSLLTSCRSLSQSSQTTEGSSITGRITTLWSRYAVALNDLEHLQIDTHTFARDASKFTTVVYTFDMYMHVIDIGSHAHWTKRQPQYQVHHRFSDCRALRLHLQATIRDAHEQSKCEFCSCMLEFLETFHFPKRFPLVLAHFLPCWHSALVKSRKKNLQLWFNHLLSITRELAMRGSMSLRCDGFVNMMYALKDFLLEPMSRYSL